MIEDMKGENCKHWTAAVERGEPSPSKRCCQTCSGDNCPRHSHAAKSGNQETYKTATEKADIHGITLNELLDVLDETVRFVVHDGKTGLHTDVCVVNPLGGRSPVEGKQLKALGDRVVRRRGVGGLTIMDSNSHVSITVE